MYLCVYKCAKMLQHYFTNQCRETMLLCLVKNFLCNVAIQTSFLKSAVILKLYVTVLYTYIKHISTNEKKEIFIHKSKDLFAIKMKNFVVKNI